MFQDTQGTHKQVTVVDSDEVARFDIPTQPNILEDEPFTLEVNEDMLEKSPPPEEEDWETLLEMLSKGP